MIQMCATFATFFVQVEEGQPAHRLELLKIDNFAYQ